jgi:hypothetical protein
MRITHPVCQATHPSVPSYPGQCAKRDPQCATNIGTLGVVLERQLFMRRQTVLAPTQVAVVFHR